MFLFYCLNTLCNRLESFSRSFFLESFLKVSVKQSVNRSSFYFVHFLNYFSLTVVKVTKHQFNHRHKYLNRSEVQLLSLIWSRGAIMLISVLLLHQDPWTWGCISNPQKVSPCYSNCDKRKTYTLIHDFNCFVSWEEALRCLKAWLSLM